MAKLWNCLAGAKFDSQNAEIAQTAFERGRMQYQRKFFLSGSQFLQRFAFAQSCRFIVGVNANIKASTAPIMLPGRLLEQRVVTSADATVRKAMARLRFEIGSIILGNCCSGLVVPSKYCFWQVKIGLQISNYLHPALTSLDALTRAWHLHTLIVFAPSLTRLGAKAVTAV